jgi:hypothetical protein
MADKTKIQITSIHCNSTSEPGSDEVYLICQADGGIPVVYPPGLANLTKHPYSMSAGDTWSLPDGVVATTDCVLNFEHEVLVTLWDSDLDDDLTVSSFLGCYDYTPDNIPSSVEIKTPGNEGYNADYIIYATKLES